MGGDSQLSAEVVQFRQGTAAVTGDHIRDRIADDGAADVLGRAALGDAQGR
ncbi:hypothetical protein [Streptomyces sp. 769]|uniref:hypothetical protein n=1 Tax=Streptomyces sp. 769 TaxID=1262452 RepID=UPI00131CD7AF|nr:hypothetical protein [Streptomyces sp. 769]